MEEKLNKETRRLAENELLKISICERMEELIWKYGMGEVERAITRNGYTTILMQEYYETVKKMCDPQSRKEEKDESA